MVVLLAFFTHGMVLVLWGVGIILGNGYGIKGFHCFRDMKCQPSLTLGIRY